MLRLANQAVASSLQLNGSLNPVRPMSLLCNDPNGSIRQRMRTRGVAPCGMNMPLELAACWLAKYPCQPNEDDEDAGGLIATASVSLSISKD